MRKSLPKLALALLLTAIGTMANPPFCVCTLCPKYRQKAAEKQGKPIVKQAEADRLAKQTAISFGQIVDAYRRHMIEEGNATTGRSLSSTS